MKICPKCLRQYDDGKKRCADDGATLRTFQDQASRMVGRVLDGRWRIEEKIGEGGMGEVYRGRQVSIDRVVAIKMLRSTLATSEEYVARFVREANIATTVSHPNLITIFDFGHTERDQVLYLAMEYLEGIPLSDRLNHGPLPLLDTLTVGVQIFDALTAAHGENIVHRDLKPENIFLVDVPEGVFVKVLDFGIAKDLGATDRVTRTGQLFGTPEYMSPEQCEGGFEIDQRSDLYAVGCLLYELLTGRVPFDRSTVIKTLLAQINDDPAPVDASVPVPGPLAAIVMCLLAKDPDARFPTAAAARDALIEERRRLRDSPDEVRRWEEADVRFWGGQYPTVNTRDGTALFGDVRVGSRNDETTPWAGEAKSRRHRLADSRPGVAALAVLMGLSVIAAAVLVQGSSAARPPEPVVLGAAPIDLSAVSDEVRRARSAGEQESRGAFVATLAAQGAAAARDVARKAATPDPEPTAVSDDDAGARAPSSRGSRGSRGARGAREPAPSALLDVRTPTSIERRVRGLEQELVGCYARRADPQSQGRLTFRFRIRADGGVDAFEVLGGDFRSEAVEDCLAQRVGRWRFTPARDGASSLHERTLEFRLAAP